MSVSLIYVFSPPLYMAMIMSLDIPKHNLHIIGALNIHSFTGFYLCLNVLGVKDTKINETGPCSGPLSTVVAFSKLCGKVWLYAFASFTECFFL